MLNSNKITFNYLFIALINAITACSPQKENAYDISMTVMATAYNSVEAQTKKGNIGLAAWGDTLKTGDRVIAVSRDLINQGLKYNQEVKIEGFEDTYIVKDKMNKRWTKKIDIYMGLNEEAAREWGKQKVEIKFDTLR